MDGPRFYSFYEVCVRRRGKPRPRLFPSVARRIKMPDTSAIARLPWIRLTRRLIAVVFPLSFSSSRFLILCLFTRSIPSSFPFSPLVHYLIARRKQLSTDGEDEPARPRDFDRPQSRSVYAKRTRADQDSRG